MAPARPLADQEIELSDHASLRVAVIGAGPSGIAAGHELLAQGFTEFTPVSYTHLTLPTKA